ncbi:MAG TPA: hypothetical protein VFT00_00995 [Nocardioides sp.]|nr:hypothetical protein [Nocardioides sp.]
MGRFARWVLVLCVPLAALAGCGQDETSGEPVPGLVQELDRIDDSIASGRYARARTALDALVETASQARESGDLSTAEADDIAVAAARLRAALPAVRPSTPEATPEPTQEPTASPTPRRHAEKAHDTRHGKKHRKKHRKKHGRGHKH